MSTNTMSLSNHKNKTKFWQGYEGRIILLFLGLLLLYLLIATFYLAPMAYYGTIDQPRFADPWIARTETIITGGLLYRDVFTTTPPLTNLLMIPPALVPIFFGNINPWATLSFMLYFSLFNLFGALVLLKMGESQKEGFRAAVLFLLNPLTFGNTVLRRQDESILVFFFALALLFILKRRHMKAAVAIGIATLVKISGGVLVPIAFLHSRNWRYLVVPITVFIIVLAPFLILAGSDAIFWDFNTGGAQHPFQYKGVSLAKILNDAYGIQIPLNVMSTILIVGVGIVTLFIVWKRFGILEDTVLLVTAVFLLSPKLHTGYFSMLVLAMAPLLKDRRLTAVYLLFGLVALVADIYKWPIENFPITFWLMIVTFILLLYLVVQFSLAAKRSP